MSEKLTRNALVHVAESRMVRNRSAFRPQMQIKFSQEPSMSGTIRGKQSSKRRLPMDTPTSRPPLPDCSKCQQSLQWIPVSELNGDAIAQAPGENNQPKTFSRCPACGIFYLIGISTADNGSKILGPVTFSHLSPAQPFNDQSVQHIFSRVANMRGEIGRISKMVKSVLYEGSSPRCQNLTYSEMLQFSDQLVAAFEDTIMEKWPKEQKMRPVPKPAYYSIFYECYEKHLQRIDHGVDRVWSCLKLILDLANM